MSHYTMLSKYGNCTHLLKIKNKNWKSVVLINKVGKNFRYFVDVLYKTTFPLALVGYEIMATYHGYLPANFQRALVE